VREQHEHNKKEEFLLLRIRAFQDRSAFTVLVKQHGPALLRFLHFKLPSREDAEDAYSTVCLQLWDYLTRTEVKHFTGLMFTVARSVVANFYMAREKAQVIPIERDGYELSIPSKDSVEDLQAKIDVSLLAQGLRELNDNEREMVILRHLEGYPVREIAHMLGTTSNTVSVTLNRALKKLKAKYERS